MPAMPPIATERLVIRPFEHADLDRIHAILNEAFPSDPPVTLAERREWLAKFPGLDPSIPHAVEKD